MSENQSKTPIAVVISDVHFSQATVGIAEQALLQAIHKANELNVPLIVNGDLHDTKSHLRSDCIRSMISCFKKCQIPAILNVGNHDKDHEKSETNALGFLQPYTTIVDKPNRNLIPYWTIIPYYSDRGKLRLYLQTLPAKSKILMHQGLEGCDSGEYIQDHSALSIGDVLNLTVISGHYHRSQTHKFYDKNSLQTGSFTYVGNPYTLNFGESSHPDKNFIVLYDDGSFKRVPTNLRKHQKLNYGFNKNKLIRIDKEVTLIDSSDLLWILVHGTEEQLSNITKADFRKLLPVKDFRLDLVPQEITSVLDEEVKTQSPEKLFDAIIENATGLEEVQKKRLLIAWKDLV